MKWKLMLLWIIFGGIIIGLIYLFNLGILFIFPKFSKSLLTFIGMAIIIAMGLITIIKGWSQVPQQWEWNVELFGKWIKSWKAGLHIGFPYFSLMKFKAIYVGEQQMKLFMSETEKEGFGFGEVEFSDGSAPVEATIYFKVENSKKATYDIGNLFKAIEEKMDSSIRAFLGLYKIDDANTIKSRAHLKNILNGERVDPSEAGKKFPEEMKYKDLEELKTKMSNCAQWEFIRNSWGVIITGFAISDIILPEAIKDARQSVLIADKEVEAAVYKKQTRITLAEGEEKGLAHEGTGIKNQVKKLITAGVEPSNAVNYLADRLKWKNVGEKGPTTIIDSSGGGIPGIGAQLGAGFQAGSNPKETTSQKIAPEKTEQPQ